MYKGYQEELFKPGVLTKVFHILILIVFAFGWMDTLWIFGVEIPRNILGGI